MRLIDADELYARLMNRYLMHNMKDDRLDMAARAAIGSCMEAVDRSKTITIPPPPEAEAPPSAAPEPPQTDGPDIYRKIEDILAALPEGMGQKARWSAGKMLAEIFAEYLISRLELEGGEGHAVQ